MFEKFENENQFSKLIKTLQFITDFTKIKNNAFNYWFTVI